MLWIRNRLAKLLAGIAVAGLAGTWAVGAVRDKSEVARMTEKMKTVCVGRFLVDMPEEAHVELIRPRIDGFDINSFEESPDTFQARLKAREEQLRLIPDRLGGNKNLEMTKEIKTEAGVTGKIFVHSRTVREGTRARGLELEHYRYEGVDLEGLVHADGLSFDIIGSNHSVKGMDDLPKLVSQLIPNAESRIPTVPGFCIAHATIRDPLAATQGEEVVMVARLPSHPDIEFMMIVAAGMKPVDQGLLERNAESRARMSTSEGTHVSTIRGTSRTIGGLDGDEVAERFAEDNAATVYSFWWEVNGTEDNVFVPHISFTMDTGKGKHGPVLSSLSEGVALGLWEKISSSLRLRPTESPRAASIKPVPIPIGTDALAGEICPQSGWWRCGDGDKGAGVMGGQRQYIKQGDRMPQALLLPPPSLWERVRGLQPSFEAKDRTSWTLVDKRTRKRVPPSPRLADAIPAAPVVLEVGWGDATSNTVTLPIGSFATTGSPCPASGWWRCEEPNALDGTRWFARGGLLPPATFALPPGVFGKTQAIQRRSVWQLMRHASVPGAEAAPRHDGIDPRAAV